MYKSLFKTTKVIKSLITIAIIPLLTLIYTIVDQNTYQSTSSTDIVSLAKCTDGDTAHFNLGDTDIVVRLLAIDTPETVKPNTPVQPYGKEASDFTCKTLTNAKEIKLEYEPGNKTDKYNRTLAWVFVDNQLLQLQLIEKGLAEIVFLYDDYKYTEQLYAAESYAKSQNIGIWQ